MSKKHQLSAGERLRVFRIERGFKVRELAEKLGIHKNFVCALQSGRRNPGRNLAALIAELTKGMKGGPIKATDWPG